MNPRLADSIRPQDGSGGGTPTRGYAEFDPKTDTKELLSAFREARA